MKLKAYTKEDKLKSFEINIYNQNNTLFFIDNSPTGILIRETSKAYGNNNHLNEISKIEYIHKLNAIFQEYGYTARILFNSGKEYYLKLSYIQRNRLEWIGKNHYIQINKSYIISLIAIIFSFISLSVSVTTCNTSQKELQLKKEQIHKVP